MPFYQYRHIEKCGSNCSEEFEVRQRIADDTLSVCPVCSMPVEKCLTTFITRTDPLAASKLKNSGFTKLTRRDKGAYEVE